jgi:AAA domain
VSALDQDWASLDPTMYTGEATGPSGDEDWPLPAEPDRDEVDDLEFRRDVAYEARRLRIRRAAADLVRAETAAAQPAPDAGTLAELLARPVEDRYRIDGLLPAGGRMLWSAQRKTGKTTAVGNLACALLTGAPFLDRFAVAKVEGRVVVLNYEVTGTQFARWMRDVGVPADRMYVVNLRGRRNLLADDTGRAELAAMIRAQDGEVLVVDPFGRAYSGKSQNDAAEVTPWLCRLDEVAESAGISELVLTAHAGWDGERTRGSSALEDWADVVVTMTRDPDTDVRFLKAEGRDVLLEEDRLAYDPQARRLSLSGDGSRKQVRKADHLDHLAKAVRDIVAADPGINVTGLREALREGDEHLQREDAGKAAKVAEERGWITREKGPRNAWQHFPTESSRVVPKSSPGRVVSSPDPSYRDGTTTRTTRDGSSPDTLDGNTQPAVTAETPTHACAGAVCRVPGCAP